MSVIPVSFSALYEYGLGDMFAFLKPGPVAVEEVLDEIEPRTLFRLFSEYESTDGQPVTSELVVDPAKNYAVVRASTIRPDFSYSIAVTNREWSPGLWFPEKAIFEHFIVTDGSKRLFNREQVAVQSATFHVQIPASEFEFDAIRLSEGQSVRDTTGGDEKYFIWDGKSLIPHPETQPVIPRYGPEMRPANSFTTILLLANAVGLAGIAVALIWRLVCKRKPQ
jgi:hypothetical protein